MDVVTNSSRRAFLTGACSLAALPLTSRFALAKGEGENRFVAIVLRGAMDGLDLVQPYSDPRLISLRPELALTPDKGLLDLDGRFGLHPAAKELYPLFRSQELSFVHAVSTPYRNQRSHFDGQDILETGGSSHAESSGWLNRAVGLVRGGDIRAIDVATGADLILQGNSPAEIWSPRDGIGMSGDEIAMLQHLFSSDRDFAAAFRQALDADQNTRSIFGKGKPGASTIGLARMAGSFLKDEYRMAAFSVLGWDTHVNQKQQFDSATDTLANAIVTLKLTMGEAAWRHTAVIATTEFGRTARQNGTGGTDHGTGSCAILAGGAIPGGRIITNWPGLKDGDLLDDRDLKPTADVREIFALMLARQFGISRSTLANTVFPGLSYSAMETQLNG
ncbi:DUF1501 domain-containing protein [Martelella alba]|uniref:DUF1501 domain-containing protein n=1 Tax=Martelella alba TaxID=2590451 RepID=A0A506UIF9_9HYPH|nr:DUF1501 domain-containing protein [Martelella alba]TPW33099.1 DUF1501 domain-containing protein [Martelella alba]